ncbi:DUF6259 domain-containing protein [Cohnella hashimotonis]|uniref:DUF6259 domain-containing protein n=1 Tax=Cohnella hashimotonis TaxID=2826895 RepID=A0ABT6TF35_9BACL|nr:DUF6259 domain-containing protein [Cohnella hashimotonis]MDI4644457.1 DUF6259 domain-containing protein [Cohnella hashimotonis]
MIIERSAYTIELDSANGSLLAFTDKRSGKNMIHGGSAARPIFTLRLRDDAGQALDVTALQAASVTLEPTSEAADGATQVRFIYTKLQNLDLDAVVEVDMPHDSNLTDWRISFDNRTSYLVEWIDFPDVVVPNDLVAAGGTARILWPAHEGVLIEDIGRREKTWLKYQETGYPSKGWDGTYPGPAPTQFMAYYDDDCGLYVGAHDARHQVKSIEFLPFDGGVRLQYRIFVEGAGQGSYQMEFNMVLGVFHGDWHQAAELYRHWFEQGSTPPRIADNRDLPAWYQESPVVVTYPVRGVKDTGNMDPNEYYPYVNAIPHLERLSERFDSKVMALLMHWEGSAPWAPPYIWPPYGGEEGMRQFADELHARGHLLGLYASGIAWTQMSLLDPDYNREADFERLELEKVMCVSPEGELPYSLICNGAQRWGYDMCPSQPFVTETVLEEIRGVANSGCDYMQYFDQNLGGLSYLCYSKEHDHPPGPGRWQTEAMKTLFRKIRQEWKAMGKDIVLGCEAAAAEPFLSELPFNDLRFNIGLFTGEPVPVYQYVYHEYINNFMGNQNSSGQSIDLLKSPDNLLWRTAYSFAAGDMLTVVLGRGGAINWDWGTEWDYPAPDQEAIGTLIRNLNAWRNGAGKPYLVTGRMLAPERLANVSAQSIHMRDGSVLKQPSILKTKWQSAEGRVAQFLVNYTTEPQSYDWHRPQDGATGPVLAYEQPDGEGLELAARAEGGTYRGTVAPLSCIMLAWTPSTQAAK